MTEPHPSLGATLPRKAPQSDLFRSFWMAGYEGADHLNGRGSVLSMNESNRHWQRLEEDYALLAQFGIRTVRESIGWRLLEMQGEQGLRRLQAHAESAAKHGVEVMWTLMHYGWPEDIDLLSPEFVERFAAFSSKVAKALRAVSPERRFYQPVNEISFLSWALSSTGMMQHAYAGPRLASGHAVKCQLVRASLRAAEAISEADAGARFMHSDPVIHLVAPPGSGPEAEEAARRDAEYAFEAWDMLCGRKEPQLGGSPRHLDVIGINYYASNQWEVGTGARLHWHLGDERRKPFSELIEEVWRRYQHPMLIAETSDVGIGRPGWLDDIASEVLLCRGRGLPVEGLCLYPILDRHDWEDDQHWHNSGLWDVQARTPEGNSGSYERVLCQPYAERLRDWQKHLPGGAKPSPQIAPSSQSFNFGGIHMPTLIIFSHLRWNFVYQRPQHLLSRLARHYHIVFMEEPVPNADDDYMERLAPAPGIEVLRPHVAGAAFGFHDDHLPVLQNQLADFIRERGIEDYLIWFYTPMALPLVNELKPRAVIYDCMDELSAFKNAPRQLIQRENALYQLADLVLTGGPSLYKSKRDRHANVHCFPSSVDAAHFASQSSSAQDHAAQAHVPHPRLGYYGVIDERLNLDLVAAVADAHPEWQVVMVGPVVKISPESLPQRPNIHWLGQQSYEDLPGLVAGWDVCLMPFALNEATRFISPTKTLEYMAAGKPSVSTRITDVAEPYGHVVIIADTPEQFVRGCESLLAESPEQKAERARVMQEIVAKTSWDLTATAIHSLIQALPSQTIDKSDAANSGYAPELAAQTTGEAVVRPDQAWQLASAPVYSTVILGAGPTGLAASYHLGEGSLLIEKGSTVGGWCRSFEDNGFTFDYAGHIMFSKDPYVLELYKTLLGDNVHWQDREAWIYSKEVYTRYPFQGALYGLPPEVLKECLIGAIEARFGPLKKETPPAASSGAVAGVINKSAFSTQPPKNFEEFIYRVWGAGVAKHFAIPYNKKLWAVPLDEMETSWLGGRVPMPDLEEMIDGALRPVTKPMGPNARFGYPLRGGFQALMDGFLPLLEGDVELEAEVVSVSPSRRTVTLKDGRSYRYETLISTLALPKLVEAMGDEAPEEVQTAAKGLRHVSVRCVNLGIGREALTDKHWIYYPEDTVFHRIFVQGNASPHCNAPGGFGLTCEITYSEYKPLPCEGQALIERCIADCIKVGIFNAEDKVIAANEIDMPYAYVVYDHDRTQHVETIRSWVAKANIVLAGRYSEWEYYNSDHAFVAGRNAAEQAQVLNAPALAAHTVKAYKPAA